MKSYRGTGNDVLWTNNTGSDVASGAVVLLATLIGIALTAIVSAASGVVRTLKAEYELDATVAEAWTVGEPLWWNPATAKLTRLGDPTYRFAGIATAAKVATTQTTAKIMLNCRDGVYEGLLNRAHIDTAIDLTLVAATHSGGVIRVTAEKTVTMPTGVASMGWIIYNDQADGGGAVTVDLDGTEIIAGANLSIANGKTAINTKATAKRGDFLHLRCNVAATSWVCVSRRGTWVTS